MCPSKDVPTIAPNMQQAMEHVMLNGQVCSSAAHSGDISVVTT